MNGTVVLEDSAVRIQELRLTNPDVVQYFRQTDELRWGDIAVNAFELGVFCLQRAQLGGSLDFVRLEIERLIRAANSAVAGMSDELRTKLEGDSGPLKPLKDKLDEVKTLFEQHLAPDKPDATLGKALAVLKDLLDARRDDSVQKRIEAALSGIPQDLRMKLEEESGPLKVLKDKLEEVKGMFDQHLDPERPEATLGKALAALRTLLDPKHDDSVQKRVESVLTSITAADGELAKAVKKAVREGSEALRTSVEDVKAALVGEQVRAEVIATTPEKGYEFEEQLKPTLQPWAATVGADAPEHVGPQNLPGDFVITLKDTSLAAVPLRIVVEARDRETGWGKARITEHMQAALKQWSGNYGIYVSKDQAGLAGEIGEWSELSCADGPILACTSDHLRTALRFALVDAKLREAARARKEVDTSTVSAQLERFRTSLNHLKQTKRKVSDIRANLQGIDDEADTMRGEVEDAISQIEAALQH